MATIDDFQKLDIRVGKIIAAEDFPQARKPAYKLTIDLGVDIGIKKSSAQIVDHYTKESLINKFVLCVVNFPARQIGPFVSEVLILGVPAPQGGVVLVQPEQAVDVGARLY